MQPAALTWDDLQARYPAPNELRAREALRAELAQSAQTLVVLDDDPTGIQTVHGVPVYTRWDADSIWEGMRESRMFFLLTNSRGMAREEARQVNRDIARETAAAAQALGKPFLLISRGDSTLRGHYPLEPDALREAVESCSPLRYDGEILCPFFEEGGRVTVEGTHYVRTGACLTPVAQTEYAADKSFGYSHSFLPAWIEEKTRGACPASDVFVLSLADLRAPDGVDRVYDLLSRCAGYRRVVTDALCYVDLMVFGAGFLRAVRAGKRFIIRCASALPKVLGGIDDRPHLTGSELRSPDDTGGGLVVAGSHVARTTAQLNALKGLPDTVFVTFQQRLVLEPAAFAREIERAAATCDAAIRRGENAVLFTSRERFDVGSGDPEEELRLSRAISAGLTAVVQRLRARPAFIVAKGGITSSDIGVTGLGVRKATVMGQILPGVPVWQTGAESKFPNLPYVIFPGNVGDENALRDVVAKLAPQAGSSLAFSPDA